MRVLVIEDDPGITRFLRQGFFDESSFSADFSADGEDGLERARTARYGLIVLDLMLPRRDGFEVLRALRSGGIETPVICLTARDGVEDRVRGLDLGADDYLTKPFSFVELLARVRAVLRRGSARDDRFLVLGDLRMDLGDRLVRRNGRRIHLSPTEYAMLELLARHRGEVLSRSMLLRHVWGIEYDPSTNVVDVHINRLRQKVDRAADRRLIHTVRGVGYVLQHEPA